MQERKEDSDKVLRQLMESGGAGGRSADSFNTRGLTREQVASLAESLAMRETGKPCFVCGGTYNPQDTLEIIELGPIGLNNQSVSAHKDCFEQRLREHPELQNSLGKSWQRYSQQERKRWKSVFSGVDDKLFFGNLFSRK